MEEFLNNNVFKIIVVGNTGSGKTSFCNRWINGTFLTIYRATIMTDFKEKLYKKNNVEYKIALWDLAGQDRNIHTTKILTKGALGVLVFCDITNIKSRNDTLKWKASIEDNSNFLGTKSNIPCFLIENKIDLVNEKIAKDMGELEEFSKKNNFCGFYRTSCKTGENVDKIMDDIIQYILDKLEDAIKNGEINEHKDIVIESKKNEEDNKNQCCINYN